MGHLTSAVALLAASVVYFFVRSHRKTSVVDIPGPPPESFLLGNLRELHQEEAGVADFKWQSEYGGVARIKAPFGEDMLWISDPKALQYIFQTSGYNFPKQPERRAISRMVADRGLTWADGETHKRQRKAMLPAFGTPEAKALLPVFQEYAQGVTSKWKDILALSTNGSSIINVIRDISPATLDAIGEAGFDYKLGCTSNSGTELAQHYVNFVYKLMSRPSTPSIFLTSICHYLPMWFTEVLYDHMPGKRLNEARENRRIAHEVAYKLLEAKAQAHLDGKGNRDIMSILVRANASENEKAKLSHDEMIAQMRTLLLAGQETTSNTLSFMLLELSRNRKCQDRLRAEIRAMEQAIRARGDVSFTIADMDSMSYLQAVVRESLRLHPVIPHNYRQSAHEDVLPLSKYIITRSGMDINEVSIPKGIRLVLSIAAYNRDNDIWGADSHTFNPDRFLDFTGKRGPTVGVFGNILTFSGGVRGCIGWRFALYELQAFLLELISNFEFELTEDTKRIRRENAGAMIPTLEGDPEKGAQMPLKVTVASCE